MQRTYKKSARNDKPGDRWVDLWHPAHFDGLLEYQFNLLAFLSGNASAWATAREIKEKINWMNFRRFFGNRFGNGYSKRPPPEDLLPGENYRKRPYWFATRVTPREGVRIAQLLYELRGGVDGPTVSHLMAMDPRHVTAFLPEGELKEAYRVAHSICVEATRKLIDGGWRDYKPTPEEWERWFAETKGYRNLRPGYRRPLSEAKFTTKGRSSGLQG